MNSPEKVERPVIRQPIASVLMSGTATLGIDDRALANC
jgi:hypothetical protein